MPGEVLLCSVCESPVDLWGEGAKVAGRLVCDPCNERLGLEAVGVVLEDEEN